MNKKNRSAGQNQTVRLHSTQFELFFIQLVYFCFIFKKLCVNSADFIYSEIGIIVFAFAQTKIKSIYLLSGSNNKTDSDLKKKWNVNISRKSF